MSLLFKDQSRSIENDKETVDNESFQAQSQSKWTNLTHTTILLSVQVIVLPSIIFSVINTLYVAV